MKHILSMGAGVQSSTMALMFAKGEFEGIWPMPDVAVFADTGAEPEHVYRWLDWLEPLLPFPVMRVSDGNLRDDIIESTKGGRFVGAPFYAVSPSSGRETPLRRQCTREYKITPITRFVREYCGYKKGERIKELVARQYIGISLDEAIRMKPAREKWLDNQWPLIDKRMTRSDCLLWMQRNGYPKPEKSSCTFCPYHSDAHWR